MTKRPGARFEPDAGAFIASLANAYANTEEVRSLASGIVNSTPAAWTPASYDHAARKLYGAVKRRFRFVPDRGEYLLGFEDVRNPDRWTGDCDDAVLILGSLASSVGIPSEVLVVGNNEEAYHAALKMNGAVYDVTGVISPLRLFKVWGVYPIEER